MKCYDVPSGVGAVWDFTPQLTNGMPAPNAISAPKDLVFQLAGMSRFREGTDLRLGFVNMDAKVLGPPIRGRPGARAMSNGDDGDRKRP
jgi:hypothetical protein